MESRATYLFAGGGTGGHLFPGIAVARELLERTPESRVIFVGSTRAIESTIVAEQGFEHRTLSVEPLPTLKRNPWKFAWKNLRAWFAARQMLRELKPNMVIGLGGFASAPLVLAANRFRVPVLLLEQNVIPGRTTRMLSRYASHVCVTFVESKARLPHASSVIVTGNPVRTEIATLNGTIRSFSANSVLLVLGGSQGADSLNEAVIAALRQIRDALEGWSVVHQTGPRQAEEVRRAYQELKIPAIVEAFFHDMPKYYATASLAISRAGASTLTELACVGIPMILLPYPHSADDHQKANAHAFEIDGAAVIVEHANPCHLTAERLTQALMRMIHDPEQLRTMALAARKLAIPDATRKIADVISEWHDFRTP